MGYFYELFESLPRGGPGDNASTRRAWRTMTGVPPAPEILDVGCGPGMQTLELARLSKGRITALDNHQPFLNKLEREADRLGLSGHIVIDKTGITEKFDFHVEYAPDGADMTADAAALPLFSSLAQLGLKLEPAKGPREFVVIDHIERPSEN